MILIPIGSPPIFVPFFFNDDEEEKEEEKPKTWDEVEIAQKKHNKEVWTFIIIFIAFIALLIYLIEILLEI